MCHVSILSITSIQVKQVFHKKKCVIISTHNNCDGPCAKPLTLVTEVQMTSGLPQGLSPAQDKSNLRVAQKMPTKNYTAET